MPLAAALVPPQYVGTFKILPFLFECLSFTTSEGEQDFIFTGLSIFLFCDFQLYILAHFSVQLFAFFLLIHRVFAGCLLFSGKTNFVGFLACQFFGLSLVFLLYDVSDVQKCLM